MQPLIPIEAIAIQSRVISGLVLLRRPEMAGSAERARPYLETQ
ncbi:hypothetical protein [Planctomyces sp. SH-PL14]|nr:hypothetical protein [Planctomyces sp. SH-PL14]